MRKKYFQLLNIQKLLTSDIPVLSKTYITASENVGKTRQSIVVDSPRQDGRNEYTTGRAHPARAASARSGSLQNPWPARAETW